MLRMSGEGNQREDQDKVGYLIYLSVIKTDYQRKATRYINGLSLFIRLLLTECYHPGGGGNICRRNSSLLFI